MPRADDHDTWTAGFVHREFDPYNIRDTASDIVRALVTDPGGFFREMPRQGGYLNPAAFLLGSMVVCGFLSMILNTSIWPLLRIPVLGTISVAIDAFLLFVVAGRLFAGRGTPEATFRVAAYASLVFTVMWIPYLDWVGFFYGNYLLVVGTGEVHGTDRASSVVSVIMSTGATLVLVLLFGFWRVGLI
jgi:hypothetical protein